MMTKIIGKETCVSIGISSKGALQMKQTATLAPRSNAFDLNIVYGAAPPSMNVNRIEFARDVEYSEKNRVTKSTCEERKKQHEICRE